MEQVPEEFVEIKLDGVHPPAPSTLNAFHLSKPSTPETLHPYFISLNTKPLISKPTIYLSKP